MEWILPDANSCSSQLTLSQAFILFKYSDDDKFVNKRVIENEETQRLASVLFVSFDNCENVVYFLRKSFKRSSPQFKKIDWSFTFSLQKQIELHVVRDI